MTIIQKGEPMRDLIERQAAIDALGEEPEVWTGKDEYAQGLNNQWHYDRNAIMALPSSQTEQRWIPCSERLPEEYGEYRITWTTSASNKRFVGDSEYEVTSEWDDEHYRFKGEWLLDDYIKNYPDVKVIAWKPLEEPYREGAQE